MVPQVEATSLVLKWGSTKEGPQEGSTTGVPEGAFQKGVNQGGSDKKGFPRAVPHA